MNITGIGVHYIIVVNPCRDQSELLVSEPLQRVAHVPEHMPHRARVGVVAPAAARDRGLAVTARVTLGGWSGVSQTNTVLLSRCIGNTRVQRNLVFNGLYKVYYEAYVLR